MPKLPFFISFLCVGWNALADEGQMSQKSIDLFLTSNVVAAVVGYHSTREVADGIRVPFFSPQVEAGKTNSYGALFYVIAPTNYANYYFYLDGEDRFNANETINYYRPDEFYWFRLSEKGPEYDVRRLFFLLPLDFQKKMHLTSPKHSRFFVAKEALENELERLARRKRDIRDELPKLEEALKKSVALDESKQRRPQFLNAKAELSWLEFYEKDAERQKSLVKEQWKVLRSSIPPGFAWGDSSYWGDLEKEKK